MTFDIDQYLATKVSSAIVDEKLKQVQAATAAKVAQLQDTAAKGQGPVDNSSSWSEKLGLEPESFLSNRVNDVASLTSGASRLVGQVASLPVNVLAMAVTAKATKEDYNAYNRVKTGTATEDDMALLNRPISPETSRTIISGFRDAEKLRGTSRDLNNYFDLHKIVDSTNRDALATDLGDEFNSNWSKITGGWDAGKHGEFAKATGGIVSGMAGLLLNAGEAVVTNPSAAREYIIENVPQLFVGALGKTGQAAMAASNMGYAADYYQQGIEKYAKENGGQLPPEDQRQRMSVLAASLALAEHAGDHASLAFMKKGGTDLTTGLAASVRRTSMATAEGFGSESATEGYQTWAEGEVSGQPATAKDIYTGAVIGGVAGAGLTGGGHAFNEAVGATPQAQAKQKEAAANAATFKVAAEANDPSPYLDPKSPDYDLSKGMGVLVAHAMKDDTSPEVKAENLKKAGELLSKLEEAHGKAQNEADTFSPASIKEAKDKIAHYEAEITKVDPANTAELSKLNDMKAGWTDVLSEASDKTAGEKARTVLSKLERQLNTGRTYMNDMVNTTEQAATKEDVASLVNTANTRESADRLVILSITQPGVLSASTATKLADDTTNSLTDGQRAHLRVFSEARQTENALSTQSKVSQEVLFGSDKNVGITQYRSNISAAIASDSQPTAERQLSGLDKFATNHQDKATTARQAMKDFGMGAQLVYNAEAKKWEGHAPGTFKEKVVRQNGGLILNSARLVTEIGTEAKALRAAHTEMKSATSLKFAVQYESSQQDVVPPGNINTPQMEEDTARPAVPSELPTAQPTPAPQTVKAGKDLTFAHVYGANTNPANMQMVPAPENAGKITVSKSGEKRLLALGMHARVRLIDGTEMAVNSTGGAVMNGAGDLIDVSVISAFKNDATGAGWVKVEQPAAAAKAAAVEQPAAVSEANPAPAAETATPEALTETKNIEAQKAQLALQEVSKAARKAKRENPHSLWSAVKSRLSETDLNDIYGKEWKKRYTFLKGRPGTSLSTMVADGSLNAFLPADMQFGENSEGNVEQKAVEYIKDSLRNGEYNTYETQMKLQRLGITMQELESQLTVQEIENEIANTQEEHEARITEEVTSVTSENTTGSVEQSAANEDAKVKDTSTLNNTALPSSEPASLVVADAPAATVVPEAKEKTTTLTVFDTVHDAALPYQEQNLVGVHFAQTAGNEDTGTLRPLAKRVDFLSAWKNKVEGFKLSDFLASKEALTDEQKTVLKTFLSMATVWTGNITANLKKGNAGYGFEDPIQFLMNEQGDLDENVKTAISYAAFSWVAENAARPELNSKEEINTILNRDENAPVGKKELNALEHVGTRQNVVINSLGQRIVAALGLKSLASAPRNLQADLEASVGAHAMKLLVDQGILVRNAVTGPEMAALTGSSETNSNAKFYFLKMVSEKAEPIFEANKGTQGIVDKVFGVEPALKEPSPTPIKPTQKTTRNTSMGIPAELQEQVANDDAMASHVRDDMYNLAGQISRDTMLAIAGAEEVSSSMHKSRRKSQQAKNDGLGREFDRFMGYVGQVGTDVPMHFEHSVWMQQRIGIATNMINPQASKIHRHMLYRSAWESKIAFADGEAMTNFKLRVAEGLGVKTDKKNKEKALADFNKMIAKPEIKAAVAVLVKSLEGPETGQLSENDQAVLVAGAKAGKENMHSLSALMAMAQMTVAKKQGKTDFISHMMAEVDGVTNGPMLSHLLLGAAETIKEMYALLNRGGFFEQGSAHTEYNNWRDAAENFDLYENTALHMTQAVNAADNDPKVMASLYAFTGELADSKGVVQSAGRNIIKTPLTAMVFGSSVNNAVDSMADNFIDSIYQAIEDGEMDRATIVNHLARLGVNVAGNVDLMEYEFSPREIKALKGTFNATIGEAVAETMKKDFSVFIAQRAEFNKTAQLTFEVYNAVYSGMREELVAKLIAEGKMAVNKTTGLPIHDLTNAQEKELRKQVKALAPIMHTAMSKKEGNLNHGIMVAKSARKLSTSPVYQNTVKFGQPFADGSKSTSVHGYEVTPTGPGVAMVPVSVHSTDAAITTRSNMDGTAQNNHDAQGNGVNNIVETARKMNEATWNTMLEYSPAAEVRDALLRTVRGLDAMMKAGEVSDATLAKLAKVLVDFSEKNEVPAEGALFLQATLAQSMAYQADSMKLDTMSKMASVNQYAMEGGAFAVESSHRSSAASLRSALEVDVSDRDRSALTSVSDKLDAAIKAEVAKRASEKAKAEAKPDPEMDTTKPVNPNPVAQLGKPLGRHDPKLTAAFKAKPNQTVKEVVALLRETIKDDFSMKLLSQLERTVAGNMVVKYITKDTVPADLLYPSIVLNARGMYMSIAEGVENQAIYVMSDDFVYSGLDNEVLLHEMVHAALMQTVRAEQAIRDGEIINNEGEKPAKPYTSDALKVVEELEELMALAKQYVADSETQERIDYYANVFENLDEFIAYGMTNVEFQNDVMAAISYTTKTGGNRLISAMQGFIDKITALFFGRPNAMMSTGMTAFLSNVSGLFEQAAQSKAPARTGPVTLAISTPGASNVRNLSTIDIYNALSQSNNGVQISAEHDTHLQSLLSTLVKSVYGPFGSFKAAMMQQTAQDPLDVYADALRTGVAPFASESLAAGFGFTDQEAFVLEQVEATMRAALSNNDGVMTIAYKEMTRLYNEVRAKLTVESFHKGDWATATQIEKDQAQAFYDFVFAIKQDASGKSDYMSRFAALGLVHSGFREQLQFYTATSATTNQNMGFNERLNKIFNTIMSWVAGRMTNTFRGQMADKKLDALVQQMVQIEAKRHNRITSGASQTLNRIVDTAEDMSDSLRAAVETFGKKPFFQNSGNMFVKLAGNTVSAIAGDRVDMIMEAYLRLRDKTMTGQLGVTAALVNEIRGATDVNRIYHFLLRGTKHLEGIRKDTISNISKAVAASFANGGEDLTNEHKAAMTAVVLRGDMQALLGTYSVAQLQNLVNNDTDLQAEINNHEQQIIALGKMNRFYINSAKGLGFFMATSKVTTAHQLMNAGNIARLYGTGVTMMSQVTNAEAAAATPLIDRLASLYAMKYASRQDIKLVQEVFAAEAARTDGGHGIEMIMKTHTALQAESKDKLFADSEALQMKGYVPEIYDPYMSVVMANDEEGLDLIRRGYTAMPGYLPRDAADPVSEKKRIYSLRDGGLKQWNSGIISTTDSKSKGSKIMDGAHPISMAGQQNASNMAAIRAGKRADIQSMFTSTGFDPTAVKAAHMAPILNPTGDVTNYRYMMSNNVKDKLLNRDNRTDHLLGAMAGNTFDKVTSKVQNANAIKALHDQYKADFAVHPEAYLQVGPNSTDPQLREIWSMLPRETQLLAKQLFGKDGMKVRNDVLDITFGYRKLSIGTVFDKEAGQRNFVERMFVEIMTHGFGEKAQLRTRQAEDIWQAIVKETKANLVVKSWSTMTGNLRSNWSQLFLMGVSPMAILNGHRVAFKSAWEYKQDSAKLFALQHQTKIGHFEPGVTAASAAYQIKRLEDSLARNPIRPLIDAGLMPTIVEDVSVDEDIYSYKSRFTEKIDGAVDAVNPHILKATRLLTMHHSTAPYKVMSYATQISDFLARYTLYQHDIKSMSHEEAVQRASEAFINYDVPTHRKIQYANDTGLIMFSKYYVRIQKVLGRIYKDAPGRVLALIAAEHMIGNQPTVLDSGFIHHFGNPFNAGALSYFSSLDSVTTVGLLTGPFTTAVYNGQ